MGSYTQLSYEERIRIETLKLENYSCRRIAAILGRHHTTISREIKRNFPAEEFCYFYDADTAQYSDERRKSQSRAQGWLRETIIRKYVRRKLRQYWSPEQIAGRLPYDQPGHSISYETIYQYIYRQAPELIVYLARKHKRRQWFTYFYKTKGNQIPFRKDISERSSKINHRLEFGHWEVDQVVSKRSGYVLSVLVERQSRLVKIARLPNKKALTHKKSIIKQLRAINACAKHSITYDNGSENALHYKINEALSIESYFCKPYHSWEKGTVENTNGLIRRYLPKKTDFSQVTPRQIKNIEHALNNRPRKCLNYQTPNEAFYKSVGGAVSC